MTGTLRRKSASKDPLGTVPLSRQPSDGTNVAVEEGSDELDDEETCKSEEGTEDADRIEDDNEDDNDEDNETEEPEDDKEDEPTDGADDEENLIDEDKLG